MMVANASAYAQSTQDRFEFRIEGGTLGQVVEDLHDLTDIEFLFSYELVNVDGLKPVNGRYTVEEALDITLRGTELSGGLTDSGMIVITRAKGATTPNREGATVAKGQVKRSLLAGVAAFLFGAGAQGGASAQDEGASSEEEFELVTIVVTATKREQTAQEVPAALSVLGSDLLRKRGFTDRESFLRTLPGVSSQDRGTGSNAIIIRGIAADPQRESAAVGIYFGETPLTGFGANGNGGGAGTVDLRLVDVDRVEVLRGPQGTLFGSGSLAGTVRVIPARPNLSDLEGYVSGEYSNTAERGSGNYKVEGALSVPIVGGKLAARVAAYHFDDSGYIDNIAASATGPTGLEFPLSFGGIARDRDDIGAIEVTGVRGTVLFEPIDQLSIKLTQIYQETDQVGIPEVDFSLPGTYDQVRLATGLNGGRDESLSDETHITNLDASYDFGFGSIFSSSSWVDHEAPSNYDQSFTAFFPAASDNLSDSSGFIQEVRFVSDLGGPFQALVGFYYEDIDIERSSIISFSGDPAREPDLLASPLFPFLAGVEPGEIRNVSLDSISTKQIAVFGELSYNIIPDLTLTFGGRYFDYDQDEVTSSIGVLSGPGLFEEPSTSEDGTTFKVNLTYNVSDDVLVYGQWAQGFRLGEPQQRPTPALCDVDGDGLFETADGGEVAFSNVESDTTNSYEAGFKSALDDGGLIVNGSLYYTGWRDIPVTIILACGQSLIRNAGEAETYGAELEAIVTLTDRLRWNVAASYGEANLTADAPTLGVGAVDGAPLPGSSDWTFTTGLEYDFLLAGYDSYLRADYSYVSGYFNNFVETGQEAGDFGLLDLRAGVTVHGVDVAIFAKNVTNEADFTAVESSFGAFGFTRGYRLRPRTIGVKAGYRF